MAYVPKAKKEQTANICFDCDNALGKCSWSEYDPQIKGVKFEVPTGAKAKPVYDADGNFYTYHITKCPLFKETKKRTGVQGMLSTSDNDDFLEDPFRYLDMHGGLD